MPARSRVEGLALAVMLLAAPLFAQQQSISLPPLNSSWSGTSGTTTQPAPMVWPPPPPITTSKSGGLPAAKPTAVKHTAFAEPLGDDQKKQADAAIQDISIQLDPPSNDRVMSKLESEAMLRRRFLQEAQNRGETGNITFPDEPTLSTAPYEGRHWPRMVCSAEPNYGGYNRLLFEQINFERYGWDLGPVGSILSAGAFFKDVLLLPYHIYTDPFRLYEYDPGYCLPGDPVPLLLYPPEISFTGALAELGAVVTLVAVFP